MFLALPYVSHLLAPAEYLYNKMEVIDGEESIATGEDLDDHQSFGGASNGLFLDEMAEKNV